ncbi:13264_t:CDS:2 [Racocetra fulgida]|uniref:13264_t:CDS:1 n=1 Tax=Racocetra fulgida TaxID=60492 RepID=A0A9N8VY45_9GLOM|nr:13264_t:CDS:2 [Racocetra fulgida]
MPQTRKASTVASAKIAKDATIGSRKRKNDSNNPEEEQEQNNLTTEETISQDNGVNNNVDDSETPPDKKRKTDDQEDHQHNGNIVDHNGNSVVHDLQESHHDHDQEMTEKEPDTIDDHYENGEHHENGEHKNNGNGNLTSQISQEPEPEPVQSQSIDIDIDTEIKHELATKIPVNTLETGHVLFLYKPKLGVDKPNSIDDVQRMYMVLIPNLIRPSLEQEPVSSFAQKLSTGKLETDADKQSIGKTRVIIVGKKKLPEINKHDSHLAYVLEVPEDPFQLQLDFNVGKKGSYALTVKNPDVANPRNTGLPEDEKVKFPEHLMDHFRGRRFISPPTTNFLDYKGAEVLLVGARNDIVDELGQEVGGELEEFADLELKSMAPFDEQSIFEELHLQKEALEKHLNSFDDLMILKKQFIQDYVEQQQTFKMTDKKNSSSTNNKLNKKSNHRKTKSLLASSQIMQLRSDSKPGIFNKGKASEKVTTKGVPDLVFSEVDFLNSRSSKKSACDQNDNIKKRGRDQSDNTHSKDSNRLTTTRRVRRKVDKILQSQDKDDDLLSDDSLPSLNHISIVDSINSAQIQSIDNSFNENELSQNNDHSLPDNNHSHADDISQLVSLVDLSHDAPLPHSNSNDHTYPTESPYFVTNLSDDGLPKNSVQDSVTTIGVPSAAVKWVLNEQGTTLDDSINNKPTHQKTWISESPLKNKISQSPNGSVRTMDFLNATEMNCSLMGSPNRYPSLSLNDHMLSTSYSETSALYLNDDALTHNGIDATVDGTYWQTDEEYIRHPNYYYSSLYDK